MDSEYDNLILILITYYLSPTQINWYSIFSLQCVYCLCSNKLEVYLSSVKMLEWGNKTLCLTVMWTTHLSKVNTHSRYVL